jgi:serine protease Do
VDPIADTPIGQSVQLQYLREKQAHNVSVVVADRAKLFPQVGEAGDQNLGGGEPAKFGLSVEDLTPELARKLGVDHKTGAIVTDVEPASFAEDIEFQRGDVVLELNHVPITSAADYRREVGKLKAGQDVLFKVSRRDSNDRSLVVFLAGVVPSE